MEPPDGSHSTEAPADVHGSDALANPPAQAAPVNPPGRADVSHPVEEPPKALGEPKAAEEAAEDSVVEPPPSPVEAPPKPATWQEKDAGEWFPEGLRTHLPMLEDYQYEDHFEREVDGPSGWKILAATRRGRLHAHRGTHREDAVCFRCGRDFIVLCMADGAGSCQYSRIGSEVTCRTVVTALEKDLTGKIEELAALDREALTTRIAGAIVEATKAAMNALEDIARNTESVPKDYRCTLLITVFYLGTKGNLALASQVGDGFFAGLNREEQARRYGTSDSGAYSGEVTCFVPDAEAVNYAARIHSIDLGDLEALIVATDGIEDPFYPLEKNAAAIFRQLYHGDENSLPGFESRKSVGPIVGNPAARERLAEWLAFEKKGENDDRTIAIVYRDPPSAKR